jgi:hypothetical protein
MSLGNYNNCAKCGDLYCVARMLWRGLCLSCHVEFLEAEEAQQKKAKKARSRKACKCSK